MALTFAYVRLLVRDYPACFRFYRDVLGLEPSFGDETSGYADFRTGDVSLALFDRGEMMEAIQIAPSTTSEGQERVALILQADNVDAAVEELKAKGVRFVTQPTDRPDWGIRVAHFRDPDGTLLEIFAGLPS
jgi:catechol 2,3-dioxygenase-like lactoylglutathione lyase family enzyme